MKANKETIEKNIKLYKKVIEDYKNIENRNKKEEQLYKRYCKDLEEEERRLKLLEMLGEEKYTELYPYR